MATRCDKDCDRCRKPKELEGKLERHICLQSEKDFLTSLLGKQKGQGLENLLGFDPTDLVDWFLYARRTREARHSEDDFRAGLKLLDELAKLLFKVGQLTAREESSGPLLLVSEAEAPLAEAYIKGVERLFESGVDDPLAGYESKAQEASGRLADYEREAQEASGSRHTDSRDYVQKLEMRQGFVALWKPRSEEGQEALRLTFPNHTVWALYWGAGEPDEVEVSRRRLARAYLEGVGRFALGWSAGAGAESTAPNGFWIDDQSKNGRETEPKAVRKPADEKTASPSQASPSQVYCGIPNPATPSLQLACEVAASFLEEYLTSGRACGSDADLFDVLFMCKDQGGWFWAFSADQLAVLKKVWTTSDPPREAGAFHRAIEGFRLGTAGFINLLERTENLVVELKNFQDEKFICTGVGYNLEAAKELAKDFATIEAGIPKLDDSSFCYFRVSSQRGADTSTVGGANQEVLPEGSLVAVVRLPQGLESVDRVRRMSEMRAWLERWRAKDDALLRIRSVVQKIERPHQRRTARAAIMSRNLSHNVGSHSLANSRFYEAIGILHLEKERPGDNQQNEPALAQRDWGGGEVALPPAPTRGEIWRARTRLGTLNGFLQGRMDFIARALGESPSHPEPLFFVNDLVEGFLSQTVLLNTLLSDNGFTAEKMRFQVFLPGEDNPVVFERPASGDGELRHAEFVRVEGSPAGDLLVGVPGGMVGRHAFYAFLENLLRNAAKYGELSRYTAENPESKFVVNLRLAERPRDQGVRRIGSGDEKAACYELTITDSLSLDRRRDDTADSAPANEGEPRPREGWVSERIRKHLGEDIIDSEGKAQTEGHGVQEMKVCAQFLAGGDLRALYYPDDETCKTEKLEADSEYCRYLDEPGGAAIGAPGATGTSSAERTGESVRSSVRCLSLRCNEEGVPSENGGKHFLAYQLLLIRPTLLALTKWPKSGGARALPPPSEATVAIHESLDVLAREPAHMGVVIAGESPDEDLIDRIARLHTALPRRLMIAVESDEGKKRWTEAIDKWQREKAEGWWDKYSAAAPNKAFPLPPRRIGVICCPELLDPFGDFRKENKVTADRWRQAVIDVLGSWLWAYKGHELESAYAGTPDRQVWHLCIGFDRPKETVESNWTTGDDSQPAFAAKGPVRLHLRAWPDRSKTTSEEVLPAEDHDEKCWREVLEKNEDARRAAFLILDNHGVVFPGLSGRRGLGAYHPLSGSEQVALYQALEHPPTDPLMRAFLLYTTVEALLTRVFVVDERVAEATIERDALDEQTVFWTKATRLQNVRIHPLYSVQTEVSGPTPLSHPLSVTVGAVIGGVLDQKGREVANEAGLVLSPCSHDASSVDVRPVLIEDTALSVSTSTEEAPDCIVIHEGVVDQVHDRGGWPEGLHQQLHAICPWVVRTSGRGSGARHLGGELPFLEFSELSDTVYRQLDKVSLGRALLSLRGKP